jgi:8-oxo-dGTP diphosphatase
LAGKTILAAGGIVVRNGARPLIAVVQRSKDDRWVLPRGKLKRTERPVIGARREVVEETGHRVRVREFLGAITYRAQGRPKVVRFWRMQAAARPSHDLMKDIAAVEWLTLPAAIRRLSYPLEKLFLHSVGRLAIPRRKHRARHKRRAAKTKTKTRRRTSRKKSAAKKSASKKSASKSRRRRQVARPQLQRGEARHDRRSSRTRHRVAARLGKSGALISAAIPPRPLPN